MSRSNLRPRVVSSMAGIRGWSIGVETYVVEYVTHWSWGERAEGGQRELVLHLGRTALVWAWEARS